MTESGLTNPSGHATNLAMPPDETCHMQATKTATSVPETTPETTPKELSKKRYGEFDNVRLTDEEHRKLVDRFGDIDTIEKIEALSGYKKSKGRSYRDDYATILTWARRDDGDSQESSQDIDKFANDPRFSHVYNRQVERATER